MHSWLVSFDWRQRECPVHPVVLLCCHQMQICTNLGSDLAAAVDLNYLEIHPNRTSMAIQNGCKRNFTANAQQCFAAVCARKPAHQSI